MTHHLALMHAVESTSPMELVPLLVPLASFGATVAIVAVALFFRERGQRLRQQTYRDFLEKGEPIPPELLGVRKTSRNADLRRGVVLLAAGLGLSIALLLAHAQEVAGFGVIPALIGVGFLVVWKIESRHAGPFEAVDG